MCIFMVPCSSEKGYDQNFYFGGRDGGVGRG